MAKSFSRALLHILNHDVLSEEFMGLNGTEQYAVSRAYHKLTQGSALLTGFEASLVVRAIEQFKSYYTPEEQAQLDADLQRIQRVQYVHTPKVVRRSCSMKRPTRP